jgi:hypothetical protein
MLIGDVYAIPLFNHAGYSFNLPIPCNCTEQLQLDVATNDFNLCKYFVSCQPCYVKFDTIMSCVHHLSHFISFSHLTQATFLTF